MVRQPGPGQEGFTLLEVLIAVMILGLSLVAILQQFSIALRTGTKTREVTRAVMYAREKLEELKISNELSESSDSGSFDDGYDWQTSVAAYVYAADQDEEQYENLRYETFQLEAIVTWQAGDRERRVELTTLRTVKRR